MDKAESVNLLVDMKDWNKAEVWVQNGLLLSSISLSLFSLFFLHLSSCHRFSSPPLPSPFPLSAGSAGDREAATHHNSMNDLTWSERVTLTPKTMKEKGCDDSEWWREDTEENLSGYTASRNCL